MHTQIQCVPNILSTKMTQSGLFLMGLALPAASEGVVSSHKKMIKKAMKYSPVKLI